MVEADPDLTVLTFQVVGRSQKYNLAVEQAAKEVESIRSAFEKHGIARSTLKTTRFDVARDETYDSKREKRIFHGYDATHGLRIELPRTTDAGAVLDAIATAAPGASIQVSFEIADRDAFRQRLLAAAVEAARRNAETIAGAAGVRLGPIAMIDYGWSEIRFRSGLDYSLNELSLSQNVADMTKFEPKAVEGQEMVTVSWVILDGS